MPRHRELAEWLKGDLHAVGTDVGYWGLGLTAEQQIASVREAEAAGYDSVWAAEAYGSDAATVLAWIAAQTEKIKIGSAIFQMPARSPAMTAMTAATLDQLSDGRMLLGIGSSGPQVAEGWHGQRFAKQLARTREYVEIVRKALARERLEYDGETYVLPLPDGPGKALKLTIAPVQERIPIYIAAIGPKNTQLVGEIADGWLPLFFSPEHVSDVARAARGGRRRVRGARSTGFDIAPSVQVAIDDDIDRARDVMRPFLALYIGGMGSRKQNFYNALVAALRLRGRGQGGPGPLPRRQEGGGRRRAPRRADRHHDARRAAGAHQGAARGLPRRRRRHADRHADRVRGRGAQPHHARARGAALSARRFLLSAFGDPGHAFPGDRARARARRARARGRAGDLEPLARARRARGHALRGGARVPGLPHPRAAAEALRGGGAGLGGHGAR